MNLVAGDVQVQRAGGEGFSHNEINPDDSKNRMLQVWALPEVKGQPASYKFYSPKLDGITRIYGGGKSQSDTFESHTVIEIVHLKAGNSLPLAGEQLSYIIGGTADFSEGSRFYNAQDGDLIHSTDAKVLATHGLHMLVVSQQ